MPQIPLDPTELAVVFLAIGAGAFIKGLTGTGFPLVAVPVMAVFLGVEHAVIVLQIPNLVSNGAHAANTITISWNKILVGPMGFDPMAPRL